MSNVKVIGFRSIEKGSLVGSVDVFIESIGLEVYGFKLFQKEGKRWFNMPSTEYTNREGTKKYPRNIHFPNEKYYEAFMKALREAFDEYSVENPQGYKEYDRSEHKERRNESV